jgi:hypothetical protein
VVHDLVLIDNFSCCGRKIEMLHYMMFDASILIDDFSYRYKMSSFISSYVTFFLLLQWTMIYVV